VKSVVFCVKIGKNSARNQSKTLIPQNKNQIFQKFLSSFPKTSYERRATRNGYIFASNVQLRLIIEGVFFTLWQKAAKYRSRSKAEIRRLLVESGRLLVEPILERNGSSRMGRNSFYILSFGFTFSTLSFKFSSTLVEKPLQISYFLCKTNPISKKVK